MVSTDAILVNWSKAIRRDNGRAHPLAVLTLHHILATIGEFGRFMRISYGSLEDELGVTHSQIMAALDTLENCGVVHRDIRFEGGRNRLYLSVDEDALTEITPQDNVEMPTETHIFFADTPEKPVINKELKKNNKSNKIKYNNTSYSIGINRKEKKGKEKRAHKEFSLGGIPRDASKKTRGMVRFEKVRSSVEIASAYNLKYLTEEQVGQCWKKMKFRFFNQGGERYATDVVWYETDQKILSRMYLDLLMERCGNFKALYEIISNMRFADLKRISMGLWNLLKVGDDELLAIAQSGWDGKEIQFGPDPDAPLAREGCPGFRAVNVI